MGDVRYADSFGEQWNRYRRVQLDSVTGKPLSRRRFFAGTGWPERLDGERVLEVGEASVAAADVAPAASLAAADRRVVRAEVAADGHAPRARAEARPVPHRGRPLLELHGAAAAGRRRATRVGDSRHVRRALAA